MCVPVEVIHLGTHLAVAIECLFIWNMRPPVYSYSLNYLIALITIHSSTTQLFFHYFIKILLAQLMIKVVELTKYSE